MDISLITWCKQIQTEFEKNLLQHLPALEKNSSSSLVEAMHYAMLNGGKRIRPLLMFAASELVEVKPAWVYQAAAAVEMIHAYSLVHDDLPCMDDDDLRRGQPTVHRQYDEATALLVGDALQTQAFKTLATLECKAEIKIEMLTILADAAGVNGMCGGQALDMFYTDKNISRAELEQMHRLKTGALLRASILIGSIGSEEQSLSALQTEALKQYADCIGLAFQVVDDILDATQTSEMLGKTAGKDAEQKKSTYVALLGLEAARKLSQQLLEQAHHVLAVFDQGALHLHQLADFIVQRQS